MVVKWQIKSFRSGSLGNLFKYFSNYKEPFIISSLLSGYSNTFKVDDGKGTVKECSFSSIPDTNFQEKIFANLDKYVVYDFKRYTQICDRFLEKFYPRTFIEHDIMAQLRTLGYRNEYRDSIINGRYDYLSAISRVIDEAAEKTITQEYFDSLSQKYGYKYKDVFLFHMKLKAKLDYRDHLFTAIKKYQYDLIIPLRNMISQNQKECYLKTGTRSDNKFLQDLSIIVPRTYLGSDLNKYIPMTEFYPRNFQSSSEIVSTWDSVYRIKNIWGKIESPINKLKNFLKDELKNVIFNGMSKADGNDRIKVSFYREGPSGIDYSTTLKRKVESLLINSIEFKRSELESYIWGIVYYMVAFDSTIIIQEANKRNNRPTILAGSLLGGLITPNYLDKEDTDFRVNPLGEGNLGCASENYGRWTKKLEEIIKDMPLYPIHLLSDSENFAQWLIDKFHINLDLEDIRYLEER